jgi:hypothetical protein
MLVLPTGKTGKQTNCTPHANAHAHAVEEEEEEEEEEEAMYNTPVSAMLPLHMPLHATLNNETNVSRQLFVSASLNGPWVASLTSDIPPCNNPSGAIHPHTGVAWLLCHGPSPKGYGPGIFIHNATSWSAATRWSDWSGGYDILRGVVGEGVREGACEDPSLSIDPRTGFFHVLAHCYSTTAFNGTDPEDAYCAGHVWSRDGTPGSWRFAGGAVDAPYDFIAQAKTGASVSVPVPVPVSLPAGVSTVSTVSTTSNVTVLSSRERPTMFVDPVSGTPLALINGVSDLGYNRQAKGRDWAWTLVNHVLP